MDLWKIWIDECDHEGDLDFEGIQSLVTRAMYESGECFVRYHDLGGSVHSHELVPLKIQVLEADFLDSTKTGTLNGNIIRQGIEFDSKNRKVAYWMWPTHPGEPVVGRTSFQSIRIPSDQILHIFRKLRPGQYRGVTAFAPSLLKMNDLDGYDDAELWRKRIEACFAAFVTQNSGSDGPIIGNSVRAGNPKQAEPYRIEEFRPGMIEYLQPGEDIRFGMPSSDSNYESYKRAQLHAIAAGVGVTYEQLTGDLSQVNYSSLRAGLVEFRRMVDAIRWQVIIPKLCNPIWKRFINRAFIAGLIDKEMYKVTWTPPKFEMIDPLKDAQADTMMIRNGTMTQQEAIARQGIDPKEQLQQIAQFNQLLDELGIVLDSDPRKTAKSGMVQTEKGEPSNASISTPSE